MPVPTRAAMRRRLERGFETVLPTPDATLLISAVYDHSLARIVPDARVSRIALGLHPLLEEMTDVFIDHLFSPRPREAVGDAVVARRLADLESALVETHVQLRLLQIAAEDADEEH